MPSVQSTVPADMARSAFGREMTPSQALEYQLMGLPFVAPRVDAALDLDPAHRLIVGNFPTPPPVNGRPQTYPVTFFPGVATPGAASPIDLGLSEEHHGADIALQPVPSVRLAGTVDGPREALAGLLLRLSRLLCLCSRLLLGGRRRLSRFLCWCRRLLRGGRLRRFLGLKS